MIGLTLPFSRLKIGMLLQKETTNSLVESVMTQLVGTYIALPFRSEVVMNYDEAAAQLPKIQPFGRLAEIRITDMNAKSSCNIKGTIGAVLVDQSANQFIQGHSPAIHFDDEHFTGASRTTVML
ncbi:hypothetical protein D3C74_118300 [compost metagenome]